ncbi:MAG: hypothetical protein A3G24_18860 [Betaproteobacteria bacterium RIFCSPLOWO2_12_FULL_62_13]|nr:MAG: hypothetical protein A3G24_18860 [Betaproteobacteria bacterium RIFCSPLOWO2_12_FULL_62_13]
MPGGLVQSLRKLAATLIAVVQTRLELLVTEIEEERLRVLHLLLWGCVALFFLAFGVLMLTFAVVVLFWDTHRLLVAVLLGAFYLAIGAIFVVVARRAARRSRLFATSLAELAKDRERLTSK